MSKWWSLLVLSIGAGLGAEGASLVHESAWWLVMEAAGFAMIGVGWSRSKS